MAHGEVEIEIDTDDPKRKRSVRAYAVTRSQMLEILSRSRDSSDIGQNLLASLVHFKILVLGLRLQCPECRQTTWYRLAGLDARLECERCLQTFDFPAADPPRDVWAYRANGPFAIENFAQGAYCVALALYFIDEQLADGATWFRARGEISTGAVEGLNNKIRVVTRRSYGFRTFEAMEVALYHTLGRLPEPESPHGFC
jgi:Transposase